MPGTDNPPDEAGINRPGLEHGKPKRILLVEDCDLVSNMIRSFLRRRGYKVFAAENAEDALERHKRICSVDMLISEAVLPGKLSGYSLARMISARQARLPNIFVTGYPLDVIAQERDYSETHSHLFKPFRIAEFSALVDKKLGNKPH